jgi:hypothetical protein
MKYKAWFRVDLMEFSRWLIDHDVDAKLVGLQDRKESRQKVCAVFVDKKALMLAKLSFDIAEKPKSDGNMKTEILTTIISLIFAAAIMGLIIAALNFTTSLNWVGSTFRMLF